MGLPCRERIHIPLWEKKIIFNSTLGWDLLGLLLRKLFLGKDTHTHIQKKDGQLHHASPELYLNKIVCYSPKSSQNQATHMLFCLRIHLNCATTSMINRLRHLQKGFKLSSNIPQAALQEHCSQTLLTLGMVMVDKWWTFHRHFFFSVQGTCMQIPHEFP